MAEKESRKWAGTTFGNRWMHQSLTWMLRYIDIRIIYGFMAVFIIPICLLILPSRRHIYSYFRRRIGCSLIKSVWQTYVNHVLFGTVVIDRFAMYAGRKFQIEIEGYEIFERCAKRYEAFIQLSAHVGNYELAGYSLAAKDKPFNALVYAGEKETVMVNRNRLFTDCHIKMIPVRPDMSHLFEIDRALRNGETLSMPADRIFGSSKSLQLSFLGGDVKLPLGPFTVATMRSLDVISVNVMKIGYNRYKVYVASLDYPKEASRKQQIDMLAKAYLKELERIVRLHPTQWYNYYEYWI
jgi:predicted LPLAT superfamily acyltransferase